MPSWNPVMWVAKAARATRGGRLDQSGRLPPMVWKCTGRPAAWAAPHSGSQTGS